jgi:hypothetical protein
MRAARATTSRERCSLTRLTDAAWAERSGVAIALPLIEALTAALPPPDGPGRGSSEGFGVA